MLESFGALADRLHIRQPQASKHLRTQPFQEFNHWLERYRANFEHQFDRLDHVLAQLQKKKKRCRKAGRKLDPSPFPAIAKSPSRAPSMPLGSWTTTPSASPKSSHNRSVPEAGPTSLALSITASAAASASLAQRPGIGDARRLS